MRLRGPSRRPPLPAHRIVHDNDVKASFVAGGKSINEILGDPFCGNPGRSIEKSVIMPFFFRAVKLYLEEKRRVEKKKYHELNKTIENNNVRSTGGQP